VTFTEPSKVVEWTTVPLNVKDGVEHQAMELAYAKAENLHTRMWSLCKYPSLYSSCVKAHSRDSAMKIRLVKQYSISGCSCVSIPFMVMRVIRHNPGYS
jgi:hypothetical protein